MKARLITPAQADYILILANGADLASVNPVTLAVVQIVRGEASYPIRRETASRVIGELRKVANPGAARPVAGKTPQPTTEDQIGYLLDLAVRKGVRNQITDAHLEKLTREQASKLIDALKEMPDDPSHVRPRRTTHNPNNVTDGMYQTPEGEIYKVQVAVHGSGKLYAKRLVRLDEPRQLKKGIRTHEFVRAEGALAKLTPAMAMTQAQAAEFGKLYGVCCNCGLVLTKESSIDQGFGDWCGRKRGWL